jgi:hypothetical protein
MTKERKTALIVGAISGGAPLVVNLVGVDAALIIENFHFKIFIGYLIKAAGLMILGGLIVFINSEEDLKKAFQLGIMAPAIVIGALNANNLNDAKNEMHTLQQELEAPANNAFLLPDPTSEAHGGTIISSLIGIAYAKDKTPVEAKKGEHNKPSNLRLIWYGISGNISNGWFVIVGSHKDEAAAERQVEKLKAKGYDARVYPPFGSNQNYGVIIGAYMTLEDARKLKEAAIKNGLPNDTYLWKWRP